MHNLHLRVKEAKRPLYSYHLKGTVKPMYIAVFCSAQQPNRSTRQISNLGVVPAMGLRVALYETKPVITENIVQTVMNRHQ